MPCACNVYTVDVDHAAYVNNGRPLCHPDTCQKVREHGRNITRVPLASPEEANVAAG
jgi:hypothetical protein